MTIKVEQNNRVCVATEEGQTVFTVSLPLNPLNGNPIHSPHNDVDAVALKLAQNLAAHLNKAPMATLDVYTNSNQAQWMRDMHTGDIHIRMGQSRALPFGAVIRFEDGEEMSNMVAQLLCKSVTVKPEPKRAPRHGVAHTQPVRRM